MRIIAGKWRGRRLVAPAGATTRPTADRVRQSVFDLLAHAPWAERDLLRDASVLDAFAGTGAMGLEALSRGAARAVFMDRNREALAAIAANIAACQANEHAVVLNADATRPPKGEPQRIVFLDPPYDHDLLNLSLHALSHSGWITAETIIVAEARRSSRGEAFGTLLDERTYGAAKILVWRGA
jgi:16S rRNA (guanine966-N2)-methyltransferase